MLLESVSEPDQNPRSGRPRKNTVVVAAAAAQPRARGIPGEQGHEGDGGVRGAGVERIAERLDNAERSRP